MPPKVIKELYRRPAAPQAPKRTAIGQFTDGPGSVSQADLLFLPSDKVGRKTYKYALVIVDLVTRTADAEPLTSKDSDEVLKGMQAIWKRNSERGGLFRKALGKPPTLRLEADSGTEFKGAVARYFEGLTNTAGKKGVLIRYGRPGRHQQQSMAEGLNRILGADIGELQAARELLTEETNREWAKDIPDFIQQYNEVNQREGLPPATKKSLGAFPKCTGNECTILAPGTPVRVLNEKDRPTTALGGRETGTRRAGDPYFGPKIHTIVSPYFIGGAAPRYIVSDFHSTLFRRNELRIVDPDEEYPRGKDVLRSKPKQYRLKALHGSRKRGRTTDYLVEWLGYPEKEEWTWEPKSKVAATSYGKSLIAKLGEPAGVRTGPTAQTARK